MDRLDELYQEIYDKGIPVFDRRMTFSGANKEVKSTIIKLVGYEAWGIFLDKEQLPTRAEEYTALGHEWAHYVTGTTHAVCSPYDLVAKHEYRANKNEIRTRVPKAEFEAALASGITEPWELADHFGVTEDFMRMAMTWYRYGRLTA